MFTELSAVWHLDKRSPFRDDHSAYCRIYEAVKMFLFSGICSNYMYISWIISLHIIYEKLKKPILTAGQKVCNQP